ncbi:uncharacterized mitochondrial protein-like protein, partial [Tanacetum coccineum]
MHVLWQHTKEELDKRSSIKDLGAIKYFLSIEVSRNSKGLVLSQRMYILDIFEDCGFQGCKPSPFPFEQNLILDKKDKEPKVDAGRYRRLVGRLLYLQTTRPDIAYSVNVLCQYIVDPRHSHMDAAHEVLRYLKGTIGQGILVPRDGGCNLTAYCDSDWLGCLLPGNLERDISSFLEEHPFHGRQRNKMWYHVPLPKQNTGPWPPRKYILDILEDCGFQGCKPSPFPFELNLILDKRDTEPKVDVGRYRRLVGRLLYNMDAAHQVLRYLKGTVGQGILLPRDGGCNRTAYCDSDWLGCPITRRSRTGYLLLFEGAPISWKTKKQNVVSRSSAEAE